MRVASTCLALSVGLALGCADEEVEARDYGSDCFFRGTVELGDGTVIDYDVAAIVDQSDPGFATLETDTATEATNHVLRLSWPAGLATGTYDLHTSEVLFLVRHRLSPGVYATAVWGGSVSFTQLGDGLAGSVSSTSMGLGGPEAVVGIRELVFGCESP